MAARSGIGYLLSLALPLWVILGFYLGGWFNFLTLGIIFIIVPFFDFLIGIDPRNLSDDEAARRADRFFYRFITYFWVYIQFVLIIWGAYAISSGSIEHWYEWMGFILSTAIATGGVGITVAHELGHKKSALERFYSQALLMTVCYMHFYIEHNKGHHVHVATPADPATARKHETIYAFWLRSVFNGYFHAWKLENERLRRNGINPLSLQNKMIWFTLLPIFFCLVLTAGFSYNSNQIIWEIPLFFFGQSIFAFTLLELVNYVEHYGIMRREISPGRFEKVRPVHSWNTDFILSNYFLFQLQRHSDHHFNAIKRYQVLKSHSESPQLPAGYPTMIILALIPPLWFFIMNPRLEKVFPEQQLVPH